MNATVTDVMTTHVVAVRQDATYKEMAAMLREHRISAFPVLDDQDKVIGVVSEADLLSKAAHDHSEAPGFVEGILRHREQSKATGVTAADLMTKPARVTGPDEPVTHAARQMYIGRVKRLPVVNPAGHLIGIISRSDVLSVYSKPDEAISAEIRQRVMLDNFLVDPGRFTTIVKDGIVTLEGTPENNTVGHDIVRAARHVEGVVAVRDRLSYLPDERPARTGPLY
jgi:CBS domain-containing protein